MTVTVGDVKREFSSDASTGNEVNRVICCVWYCVPAFRLLPVEAEGAWTGEVVNRRFAGGMRCTASKWPTTS